MFLTFFFTPAFAFASTDVSGTLSADTVWTKANSPYIVGYTVIPQGVTLTVEEGTIVKFSANYSTLEVGGKLLVHGTVANPAYFTSINDNTPSGEPPARAYRHRLIGETSL